MTDLDTAAIDELQQLCDHARAVVEANRHRTIDDAHPAVSAALEAVTARLRAAGIADELAGNTMVRWFLTRRPIPECLAIEADPPYASDAIAPVPGTADTGVRRRPRGSS